MMLAQVHPRAAVVELRGRLSSGWLRHSAVAGSLATAFALQAALVVSGVLVARVLGVENRGHFALLAIFPLFLSQIGTLGLPLSATYYISRDRSAERQIVASLVLPLAVLTVLLVCIHALIIMLIFEGKPEDVRLAAWTTLPAAPAWLAQSLGLAILQGQQRFTAFNALRTIQVVVYSTTIAFVFLFGGSLPQVALAWTCSLLVAGAVVLAVALRGLTGGQARAPQAPARGEMGRFGLKSLVGSVSPIESFRLDQLAVGLIAGPAALGLYVVGFAFTNLPRFAAQSIGMVAYPKVAASRRRSGRAVFAYVLLTLFVCGGIVAATEAASGWLVPFFFGAGFADAVPLTRVLLLSALLFSLRRVLSDCARGAGRPEQAAFAELLSWLALLPALGIAAHHGGALGVAWALVLTPAVSLAVLAGLLGRALAADKEMAGHESVSDTVLADAA